MVVIPGLTAGHFAQIVANIEIQKSESLRIASLAITISLFRESQLLSISAILGVLQPDGASPTYRGLVVLCLFPFPRDGMKSLQFNSLLDLMSKYLQKVTGYMAVPGKVKMRACRRCGIHSIGHNYRL